MLEREEQKTNSNRRGLYLGIAIGIALAVGATQLLASRSTKEKTTVAAPETTTSAPAQSVTVAEVQVSPISRTENATGTVAAFEMIPVLSPATGLQIKEVLIKEGALVREGQLLARLDDSVLQARLARARATVAESRARLAELKAGTRREEIERAKARLAQDRARLEEARASIPRRIDQAEARVRAAQARLNLAKSRKNSNEKLVQEGAISQDQFDAALTELQSAEATLLEAEFALREAKNTNRPEIERLTASVIEGERELAQLQAGPRREEIARAAAQLAQNEADVQLAMAELQRTLVVAPRRGKVATRNARVGAITSSSERLFEIIEDNRLELLLNIPETQLSQIRIGQKVKITADPIPNLQLEGKVREIIPIVEEQSRQGTVKVDLPSVPSLRPGMFLRGEIFTSTTSGLTVPAKAVLPQSDGTSLVYVLNEDKVRKQRIEMGAILPGDQVEIKQGLKAGERVVVKGSPYLKDGDPVAVVQ